MSGTTKNAAQLFKISAVMPSNTPNSVFLAYLEPIWLLNLGLGYWLIFGVFLLFGVFLAYLAYFCHIWGIFGYFELFQLHLKKILRINGQILGFVLDNMGFWADLA